MKTTPRQPSALPVDVLALGIYCMSRAEGGGDNHDPSTTGNSVDGFHKRPNPSLPSG
jgi:hypothetical protein